MKIVFSILDIILIIADIVLYIDLRRYIKKHENELLEDHRKPFMIRAYMIVGISMLMFVLIILMNYIL